LIAHEALSKMNIKRDYSMIKGIIGEIKWTTYAPDYQISS
jgi:hypothetical protein